MKKLYLIAVLWFLSQNLFASNIYSIIEKKYNLPKDYIINTLKKASIDKTVLSRINKPAEKLPFKEYRKFFLNKKRVKTGKQFVKKYNYFLAKSEKTYKVDKHITAAIIGVESFYAKHKFSHKALSSLYTLATSYKRRSKYFTDELGALLYFSYKNKLTPEKIKSSYAGAIGIPQFMPSNILKFAVDFNNNRKIDIINEIPDAIGSVANYLHKKGWKYKQPTAVKVRNVKIYLLNKWDKISFFKKHGVKFPYRFKKDYKVKIIRIDNSFWATFENFYVIKRYNPSDNYALAVLILSKMIR